jgi:hypothetical protein
VKYIILILLVISGYARGDTSSLNLNIPTSPQSYASDQFRAGDMDCRQAIGSSTNLEFGVVGVLNQNDPFQSNTVIDTNQGSSNDFLKDIGVYAKITIPIGAPKQRIDCNSFFKLEMERRRLEVLKLQQEITNLRRLNFEDDN